MKKIFEQISSYAEAHKEETLEVLEALAEIPAPSHEEEKRAAYIKAWTENQGIPGARIDQAGNVVCLFAKTEVQMQNLCVVMAHMDTVFTEKEPFTVVKDGTIWRCPGIGDDTANLVNMMMAMKFFWEHWEELSLAYGILFAANVGEEGLGNLKGSRQIYAEYGSQIARWLSLDLYYNGIYNSAVGSHRYQVVVQTKGGHSFGDFGNANAIAESARIIARLYQQQVPVFAKTTYNVGLIEGGTSVNTIAQRAAFLYEFRSESNEGLRQMQESFAAILKEMETEGVAVAVKELGIRPGNGEIDQKEEQLLCDQVLTSVKKYYEGEIKIASASTDCNIPLSQGIPAVCFGSVLGAGLHTKEEWIDTDSMMTGQKIALDIMLHVCGA